MDLVTFPYKTFLLYGRVWDLEYLKEPIRNKFGSGRNFKYGAVLCNLPRFFVALLRLWNKNWPPKSQKPLFGMKMSNIITF